MQTDKEFEDFFRDRLNGLEETPPLNAWNKIKEDIKPTRTYYREMAAVLLLCLISVVMYLGLKKQSGQVTHSEIAAAQKADKATQTQPATSKNASEIAVANGKFSEGTSQVNAPEQVKSETQNFASAEKISTENAQVIAGTNVASSTTKTTKPLEIDLIVAPVKKAKTRILTKENSATVNSVSNLETTFAFNSKTNKPAAFTTEQRYASEAKNSAKTLGADAEKVPASTIENSTKEIANAATALTGGTSTETKIAASENASQNTPKTETLLALNTPARTDSVALPTIPELLADSADLAKKAVAKRDDEEKNKTGKFAVTVTFTPGIISRRLIANPNDEQYVRFNKGAKRNNAAELGYDMSATLHHRVNSKTTIDGGFSYTKLRSNVNYQVSNGDLIVTSNPTPGNPSAAVKVDYAFADEEFQNEFTYGGLRVGVSQELLRSASQAVFVSGGAGLNMLLSDRATLRSTHTTSTGPQTENSVANNAFHTVNSHVYLSAGLERVVMPKVSLLLAPAFTYYLNSAMQKKHIFEMKPYTFGLNIGLRYQL